jgi:hypothetical protein
MKPSKQRTTPVELFRQHEDEIEKIDQKIREEGFGRSTYRLSLSQVPPRAVAQIAASISIPMSPRERIELAYELLDRAFCAQSFLSEFQSVEVSQSDFDRDIDSQMRLEKLISKEKCILDIDYVDFKKSINLLMPGSGGHKQKQINLLRWIQYEYRCDEKEAATELECWKKKGIPQGDFLKAWIFFPKWHEKYKPIVSKISGNEPPKEESKPRGRPRKGVGAAIAPNQKAEVNTHSGTNSTVNNTARNNASAIGLKTEKPKTKKKS